ncbi:DUF4123 domain-containing protein [Ralstonia chuxiongensis]|uniref:DUF4123 domain-containing protein n=1 Tax=Ralstonia chuxiongensis TaxID=2957504 RepID=UPI0028F6924C|nr:DUF4123 domain-containing protein [Ralstonia chuxiongensis]CAJ0772633.1 hypothetical protein R8510_02819 [Ralstonia chuxiongensis]
MQTYIVVDSSQQPGLYRKLARYQVQFRSLFQGFAEESLPEIAPLLVKLPDKDEPLKRRIDADIEHLSQTRPCVCKLESSLGLDALAQSLSQFHIVEVPTERRMIMRWYDTRVLPVWWNVLLPTQRAAFAQGVMRWSYYDRFGDEAQLDLSGLAEVPVVTPLVLTEAQYARLLHAAEPDVLIAHLRNVIRDEMRAVPARILYPFVAHHLEAARQHGLYDFDDQTQYLLIALYTSGQFVGHPEVTARLSIDATAHEQSFGDWATSLPESIWNTGLPLWQNAGSSDLQPV